MRVSIEAVEELVLSKVERSIGQIRLVLPLRIPFCRRVDDALAAMIFQRFISIWRRWMELMSRWLVQCYRLRLWWTWSARRYMFLRAKWCLMQIFSTLNTILVRACLLLVLNHATNDLSILLQSLVKWKLPMAFSLFRSSATALADTIICWSSRSLTNRFLPSFIGWMSLLMRVSCERERWRSIDWISTQLLVAVVVGDILSRQDARYDLAGALVDAVDVVQVTSWWDIRVFPAIFGVLGSAVVLLMVPMTIFGSWLLRVGCQVIASGLQGLPRLINWTRINALLALFACLSIKWVLGLSI